MPRDVFDSTTEFEAVEREKLLPHGTRWHYNADGTRVVIPTDTDIQGDVHIDPTAKVGTGVTILEEVTSVGKGATIRNNVVVERNVAPNEVVRLGI